MWAAGVSKIREIKSIGLSSQVLSTGEMGVLKCFYAILFPFPHPGDGWEQFGSELL